MDIKNAVLGIELGSTRIKAVLIGEDHKCIASGSYAWENHQVNGVWTYPLEEAIAGIRASYKELRQQVRETYGVELRRVAAIGISAMMHGYLVFNKEGELLVPFRTWRNTITAPAAAELSELFRFNIPQRWSVAHLYQAILNGETHVPEIALLTTLSGYIHKRLTGKTVIGACEASGMFPYDEKVGEYDAARLAQFDRLVEDRNLPWKLREILPDVVAVGECAGVLTEEGAALLDETGALEAGIPFCPPEGDAATGMVATGAVLPRTGSVSAGTSSFALLVLERPLKRYYPEIDTVVTPTGKSVALVHANNCTPEIDVWVKLIADAARVMGWPVDMNTLYTKLYQVALEGDPECGNMVSFNYFAGEHMTGVPVGRPMLVRMPDSKVNIANFMRAHLNGAIATLKIGVDMLVREEKVETDTLLGHGGFFKTPGVGQQILANALNVPVSTMETAGEGGPWGMAILASYMCRREPGESFEDYLEKRVFANAAKTCVQPDPAGVAGFEAYMTRYMACMDAEIAAAKMI